MAPAASRPPLCTAAARVVVTLALFSFPQTAAAAWSSPRLIAQSVASGLDFDSRPIQVAVSGSTVHVIWLAERSGGPRAARVDGDRLHLLWADYEYFKYGYIDGAVYYAARQGDSWGRKVRVSGPESGFARSLAAGDGEVYVAWEDWNRRFIAISHGRSRPDRLIKRIPTRGLAFPAVALATDVTPACEGSLHLAYQDRVAGRSGLVYQRRGGAPGTADASRSAAARSD